MLLSIALKSSTYACHRIRFQRLYRLQLNLQLFIFDIIFMLCCATNLASVKDNSASVKKIFVLRFALIELGIITVDQC